MYGVLGLFYRVAEHIKIGVVRSFRDQSGSIASYFRCLSRQGLPSRACNRLHFGKQPGQRIKSSADSIRVFWAAPSKEGMGKPIFDWCRKEPVVGRTCLQPPRNPRRKEIARIARSDLTALACSNKHGSEACRQGATHLHPACPSQKLVWGWVKIKPPGTAGFRACFHLPGFHFRYLFRPTAVS